MNNVVDYTFHSGIIDNPQDSIFFYKNGQDWSDFYSPTFSPVFEPTFASVGLGEQAKELCKNDTFCLFDVAATGRVDIGHSTLEGSINFELLVNLSKPGTYYITCILLHLLNWINL